MILPVPILSQRTLSNKFRTRRELSVSITTSNHTSMARTKKDTHDILQQNRLALSHTCKSTASMIFFK
jgi:hypothetical protein